MVVAIVRRLDKQGQYVGLNLLGQIVERLSEGTASIDGAFSLEVGAPASRTIASLAEVSVIRIICLDLLEGLAKHGGCSFVIDFLINCEN